MCTNKVSCPVGCFLLGRFVMRELRADYAGANLHNLIEEEAVTGEPVMILGRKSKAVLVGEGDWIAINETLFIVGARHA